MSRMNLELAGTKTRYRPGETLEGLASWDLDKAPKSLEVRLYWRTQGRGTVDLEIVRSVKFEGAGAQERRPFQIALPPGPYSFSGRLVSIIWGVELVAEPKGDAAHIEITMSPGGGVLRPVRDSVEKGEGPA
jgi:hypothetical protein